MTTTEARSAARARIRAFLEARESYASSLPPGAARYAMTDEISRQAADGSGVIALGTGTATVETVGASTFMAGSVPLLASDLALLATDDEPGPVRVVLPNEDFDALAASLDEPAAPVPELVGLFKREHVTPVADES